MPGGRSHARGAGFGFRGSSPPWPCVGRGKGGLPRCGYYFGRGVGARYPFYTEARPTSGYEPLARQMTKEQELDFLKGQAEAIKGQLERIEARLQELARSSNNA